MRSARRELRFPMLLLANPSAGRLNHDFIDDGQTVKKYINHAYCAERALGYSEVCVGLPAGRRRLPESSNYPHLAQSNLGQTELGGPERALGYFEK